ncbi:MAG: hypothetical protein M4579_002448 [Chaenotheca gracillima]|nr:MAG: hypothetical protein M4579_002448 [Chaenotheca gracillima]
MAVCSAPFRAPSLRKLWRIVTRIMPPFNFITAHYYYYIITCLVVSVVFWGASTPARSISYTDSLFLVVSAMTLSGLNTINLSTCNTFQQVVLFILLIFGSAIFVSSFVVHVRKRAFELRFDKVIEKEKRGRRLRSNSTPKPPRISLSQSISRGGWHLPGLSSSEQVSTQTGRLHDHPRAEASPSTLTDPLRDEACSDLPAYPPDERDALPINTYSHSRDHIAFSPGTAFAQDHGAANLRHHHSRVLSTQGVGVHPNAVIPSRSEWQLSQASLATSTHSEQPVTLNDRFNGLIGRNSQFHRLSIAERERLGGVEYRALSILAILVPLYFVVWQLLGCLGAGAYIAKNHPAVTKSNGLNPWWVGAFNAVSAFNNSGMSLLDANMTVFQDAIYLLLTMGLMMLAGNTCYPIFLRLIIWALGRLPFLEDWKEPLQFLLDHPRRCYTNLFPSAHTWWLFFSVVTLNGIDWLGFEVLNIGNPVVTSLPTRARVVDGLFQAFAVRSGGFYVISISSLRIGLQVLYVIMMYISVFPVVLTMRNSNVYEERSLGIYADDPIPPADNDAAEKGSILSIPRLLNPSRVKGSFRPSYFVQQQLRAQLAHDLWLISLAVLFITIIETGQFEKDPKTFSVFNIIFEVISGYGCVGISTGLPNEAYSFCGAWHVLSKLILCAVMIRGRHRGLPVAIDRAVLLPGEHLAAAEEEDAMIRMERTHSRGRAL